VEVHEVAAEGFDAQATTYDRVRPSYPLDAVGWLVDHLRVGPGARVLDLAAGTGKLTRLLAPAGATLLAAEPVTGMARVLHDALPHVPLIAATAESLPVAPGALDAVTVAQAFHWFDADRAFAQLRRALRIGGRVGFVWNARDRSRDWVDRVWGIMDRVEKRAPWREHEQWRDSALGERAGFGTLHEATFRHEQHLGPADVVARVQSVSHVAVLPDAARDRVLAEVRELLATHPDTRGRDDLALPYRVDAYWCERIA
jgi:SAM-dependent methyltransferase